MVRSPVVEVSGGGAAIATLARKDSYLCTREDIQAILRKKPGIYLGFCGSDAALKPAGNSGKKACLLTNSR
jgi:hypothetical protein